MFRFLLFISHLDVTFRLIWVAFVRARNTAQRKVSACRGALP